MADYFCDHGAYATALGATPTWGVPQEGDGSTKDAATAGAIASIKFNAVPTTGAFTICGVSPSTTGVLSAASAAAAATALADNINATTTAVGATVAVGLPQLRNLVFARVNPGDSAMVQIMMRVGSTSLNHASNSNVALAHSFNNAAPTLAQFIGGAGGCWGYLANDAAIGVASSIAAWTYSVLFSTPIIYPAMTKADRIWVRTGTSPVLNAPTGSNVAIPHASGPRNVFFDTNTKWAGDPANGVFTINLTASSGNCIFFATGGNDGPGKAICVYALRAGGLKVTGWSPSGGLVTGGQTGGFACFTGIHYVIRSGSSGHFGFQQAQYQGQSVKLEDCLFDDSANSRPNLGYSLFQPGGYQGNVQYTFIRCKFKWNLTGTPADVVPIANLSNTDRGSNLVFIDTAFEPGSATKLRFLVSDGWVQTNATAIRCTGLVVGSSYTLSVNNLDRTTSSTFLTATNFGSRDAGREIHIESGAGVIWWKSNSPPYPTLAATQLDGSPWCFAVQWSPLADAANPQQPCEVPPLLLENRLPTGVRTITVEVMAPNSVSNATLAGLLSVSVAYQDGSGVLHFDSVAGTAGVTSSPLSWTGAGGWPNHTARRFQITTSQSIGINTEIAAAVRLMGVSPTGSTETVFVDPEFQVA